jgi:hypothetical protein
VNYRNHKSYNQKARVKIINRIKIPKLSKLRRKINNDFYSLSDYEVTFIYILLLLINEVFIVR